MSARVMLMVRLTSGRVVAVPISISQVLVLICGLSTPNERERLLRRLVRNRPWWLVKANSADAARKVIEHYEHNGEACVHGRVLASGRAK